MPEGRTAHPVAGPSRAATCRAAWVVGAAIGVILVASCAASPPPLSSRSAAHHLDNRSILFERASQIYGWTPPSKRVRQVTHLAAGVIAQAPVWSVDHTKIAYATTAGTGQVHLDVARPDGSQVRQVTFGNHGDADPSWSPGGSRLVFGRGTRIAIVDLRSGRVRLLSRGLFPAWDPRGGQILFTGDGRDRNGRIFAIRPDGTHLRALTPKRVYAETASATGRIRSLTPNRRGVVDSLPSFSPSGSRVVFEADTCDGPQCEVRTRLYVTTVRPDGGSPLAAVGGPAGAYPSW